MVIFLATFLTSVACKSTEPVVGTLAPSPTSTAVIGELVEAATDEATATVIPTSTVSETDGLAAFVAELAKAISNQDYGQMQDLMSDPFGVGAWRSEWQTLTPAEAIEQFQSGTVPSPSAVGFSNLDSDQITTLIGQPPETMLGPGNNVAAVLHSSGWGQASGDEAILFVVKENGRYYWSAFLYNNGRFADASLGMVAAPVGLIYRVVDDGLYQIQADGRRQPLLDEESAAIPNLTISPDGLHAAYLDDERRLWLVDTTTSSQRQLAGDHNLSYFLTWGDEDTLFTGVWLNPNEADGPNNGHLSTVDINTGSLQIIDEENLSGNRPALSSDYDKIAFDVFAGVMTGRLFHPDSGLQVFDPNAFTGGEGVIQGPLFNPAWSASGENIAWLTSTGDRFAVQVFDLDANMVIQLHDWDPARFGGLVPSPVWSSDGQWLALEILANGPEGSGVWLMAADGSKTTLLDSLGHDPHWINDFQLFYNLAEGPRLFDVSSGETFLIDLPTGSRVIEFTDPEKLPSSAGQNQVLETDVSYVQAQRDVPLYSGPGEKFENIGEIFDGQTALVTGQSFDGAWWRVICPDSTIGECWVSADPESTLPSSLSEG